MDSDLKLFRDEAKHPGELTSQGSIVLLPPVLFGVWTWVAVLISATIVGFFIWGTYTQRSTVIGQLAPDVGVIKVYTPQFGTITQKHVTEGSKVHKGDLLYVFSSDYKSSSQGDLQALISQDVESRRKSLQQSVAQTRLMAASDLDVAKKKLAGLEAEYAKVDELLGNLKSRVSLAEQAQQRYENLRKQGYLSQEDLLVKQADLLDQKTRLQTLDRDHISLQRQIDDQKATIQQMPLRYQTQIAELERSIASAQQELSQSEAARSWVVTAPEDGIASAVVGEVGQTADSGRVLMALVPEGAKLQAQLYAPSRSVGFIKAGDTVYLRYQSFPYQKFGHYAGEVASISRTAAPANELTGSNAALSSTSSSEPVYRVTVNLDSQSVSAYGKRVSLQAGMVVEADVLQETRHLYEWVLEPLFTLTGKIH
jgi:membrane fusion protein